MELVALRSRHAFPPADGLVAEGIVNKDPQGKLIPYTSPR